MKGSRLECSCGEDTFRYNHCYICVVYSTLLCIQWTNLSPYLKHLVFLDVQKCTKYVKSRVSKILQISFCENSYEILCFGNSMIKVINLSEHYMLYLCWFREEGKESAKGFKLVCLQLDKINHHPICLCILFYLAVYIVYIKGQRS